jgi:hypothetical protein
MNLLQARSGSFTTIGLIFSVVFAVSAVGCESSNLGTVDPSKETPLLSNASLTPDTIYVDNLTPVNDRYQITATLRVTSTVSSSISQTVTATVIRPNSSTELQTLTLSQSSGAVFTGQLQFSISRAQAGRYRIQFLSQTADGLQGNALEIPLKLGRRNSPPTLSNLNAPDSVTIPTGGSVRAFFTIVASDSDGIADVREVYFKSIDGQNPDFKFLLRDDGNAVPLPNQPPSGDLAAGDGTYSILLTLADSPTIRGRYRFLFNAEDADSTSPTILHVFTIR